MQKTLRNGHQQVTSQVLVHKVSKEKCVGTSHFHRKEIGPGTTRCTLMMKRWERRTPLCLRSFILVQSKHRHKYRGRGNLYPQFPEETRPTSKHPTTGTFRRPEYILVQVQTLFQTEDSPPKTPEIGLPLDSTSYWESCSIKYPHYLLFTRDGGLLSLRLFVTPHHYFQVKVMTLGMNREIERFITFP